MAFFIGSLALAWIVLAITKNINIAAIAALITGVLHGNSDYLAHPYVYHSRFEALFMPSFGYVVGFYLICYGVKFLINLTKSQNKE